MSIQDPRERLIHGSPKEKVQAIKELVGLKSRDAGKVLVQALKQEKHAQVREHIQKGIQYLKKILSNSGNSSETPAEKPSVEINEQVLERVRKALTSGSQEEEKKAFTFIIKNQVKEILPFLIETSLNRNQVDLMISSLKVIERLNATEHTEDLVDFLRHKDPGVCSAAIQTATTLQVLEDFFPSLKELIRSEHEEVSKTAHRALEELASAGSEDASLFLEDQKEEQKEPETFVPDGMDDLLPQLKHEAEQEKKEDEQKKRKEAVILFRYKEELESEDPQKRMNAIRKLAEAKDPEAIELITQILANESDHHVLATGLSSLGHLGRESAVATLQNYLTHEDHRVRANAIDAINMLLGPDAQKPMLEKMLKDPHHRVRSNVILSIFNTKPNECFLALNNLAHSSNEEEQLSALYCFEFLQQDTHLGMLQRFFSKGGNAQREKTRQILENWTGDKEISQFILEAPADKFQEFYKNHLEKKRQEAKRAAAEPQAMKAEAEAAKSTNEQTMDEILGDDEEEDAPPEEPPEEEAESFFSKLLKRFK
jgi:hypothetical protein